MCFAFCCVWCEYSAQLLWEYPTYHVNEIFYSVFAFSAMQINIATKTLLPVVQQHVVYTECLYKMLGQISKHFKAEISSFDSWDVITRKIGYFSILQHFSLEISQEVDIC